MGTRQEAVIEVIRSTLAGSGLEIVPVVTAPDKGFAGSESTDDVPRTSVAFESVPQAGPSALSSAADHTKIPFHKKHSSGLSLAGDFRRGFHYGAPADADKTELGTAVGPLMRP